MKPFFPFRFLLLSTCLWRCRRPGFASGLLVGTALAVTGCTRPGEPEPVIAERLVVGPEYSASKGLFVPDETRRALALRLVDVAEQSVSATAQVSLRVYHVNAQGVRASGQIAAELEKRVAPGQGISARTRDGREITGRVIAVGSGPAASATREMLVEMPAMGDLTPGAFIVASVPLPAVEAGAVVPREAVVESTEGPFVYTVSGGHFVRTAVRIGATTEQVAEITDGLYAGDQVVARGAMALWLTELAAIKGGHSCCVVPPKGSG